ncbi:MAG: CBS domain-containing protein [Acidimicrobiales bacterium]
MQVRVLLQGKGSDVVAVRPDATLAEVVDVLARHRIGAVVVSGDQVHVDGVLSERDIVRVLAEQGAAALEQPARSAMTSDVVTCEPDATVEDLMSVMTTGRFRHIPVVVGDRLAGVVSIGDIVKDRISSLEQETKVLHDYISNPTY